MTAANEYSNADALLNIKDILVRDTSRMGSDVPVKVNNVYAIKLR